MVRSSSGSDAGNPLSALGAGAPPPPLGDTSADQALRAVHVDRVCERVREEGYVVDSAAVAGALLERLLGR